MAVTTCPKCAGHSFELAPLTPLGTSHRLTVVQCAACGAPAGVLDPVSGPQVDALKTQVSAIDEKLERIVRALQK